MASFNSTFALPTDRIDNFTVLNSFFDNGSSNINSTDYSISNVTIRLSEPIIPCSSSNYHLLGQIKTLSDITSGLWKFFSPILFLIGMVGNCLILAVLRYMKFWRKPSLFFLAVLAVADSLVLSTGLSRYWIREVFDYDLRTYSDVGCKVNLFFIYWSMHLSSWSLVCVVMERFIKTNFPLRYSSIVSIKRCVIVLITLILVLSGIDAHFFWTNGLITNGTECSSLTTDFFYYEEFVFTFVDLAVLSAAPFFTMVVLNIFIIRVMKQSMTLKTTAVRDEQQSERMKKFDAKLTRMLLITSIYFLMATTPISVYFILDSFITPDELSKAKMDIVWSVSYIVQFSNYTVNFFLYNISNTTFKRNLKQMLRTCRYVYSDIKYY